MYWFRGDGWSRTSDTRIFSAMLYQLSYVTILTESSFSESRIVSNTSHTIRELSISAYP